MLNFKKDKLFVDKNVMTKLSNDTETKIIQVTKNNKINIYNLEIELKKMILENYHEYAISLTDIYIEHNDVFNETNKYKVNVRYVVNHYPLPNITTKTLECETIIDIENKEI